MKRHASDPPATVMIFGSGRSGTTWLGRIFDTLPQTVYRHEPDLVVPPRQISATAAFEGDESVLPLVAQHLQAMTTDRSVKVVGSRPVFRKSYRSTAAHVVRLALIYGMRGAEWAANRRIDSVKIPDLVPGSVRNDLTYVIKSVTGLPLLPLYACARPSMPIIHMVRHPCAVVASLLRGVESGKMPTPQLFSPYFRLPLARESGLTPEDAGRLTVVETAAWRWTLANDTAVRGAPPNAQIQVVRYEDMCHAPVEVMRPLVERTGLSWSPRAEAFLTDPPARAASAGYHAVRKDPAETLDRWREDLHPEQVATIRRIAAKSAAARYYDDLGAS